MEIRHGKTGKVIPGVSIMVKLVHDGSVLSPIVTNYGGLAVFGQHVHNGTQAVISASLCGFEDLERDVIIIEDQMLHLTMSQASQVSKW